MSTAWHSPSDHLEFITWLRDYGIERIEAGSLLASLSSALVRGWCVALDRARRPVDRLPVDTRAWAAKQLSSLASVPNNDEQRARAGEVEAALRLAWIGSVERVQENPNVRTVDLRLEGMNVEVYCPQEHTDERRVVEVDLAQQLARAEGPVQVAVTISHPTTGSGRSVRSGEIVRDPKSKALDYPANKLMDRLLSSKRDAGQFPDDEPNILWLDLKHGLGVRAVDCMPFRSELAKGQCYVGTHGIWHAFYGESDSPHFEERTTLEWPVGHKTYPQQVPGWFRETPKVSAAILSVLDGVILFENPWANVPLAGKQLDELFRLSELRPEFSWSTCAGTLGADVAATLGKIAWMGRLAEARWTDDDAPPSRRTPEQ